MEHDWNDTDSYLNVHYFVHKTMSLRQEAGSVFVV